MLSPVPYYALGRALAGFALEDDGLDDETVGALEGALAAAMPGLDFFHFERAPGLLLVPAASPPLLRDAGGVRAFRSEDFARFEAAARAQIGAHFGRAALALLRVDLMYGFDWVRFGPDDHDELGRRCRRVLGWCEAPDLPRFFAADETRPPHLAGSIEPPGLQVSGVIDSARLRAWHASFREATAGLPAREDLPSATGFPEVPDPLDDA